MRGDFRNKKFWIAVASVAALLFAVAGAIVYSYPLEAYLAYSRWDIKRHGVSEVRVGGMSGFLRDNCNGKRPEQGCRCVALIHGLADDALTWKKLLILPENGWVEPVKLYALNMPGTEDSDAPRDPSGWRVRKQAETLRQALAPLCPTWTLVGNSLGGWIASWMALDWPKGVNRLVLLSTAGMRSLEKEKDFFLKTPTVEYLKEFQRRAYFAPRPLSDRMWEEVVEHIRRRDGRRQLEAQTAEDFLDERWPNLHTPTVLFWGEADRIIPIDLGQRIKALVPGAIWKQVAKCGHIPQKECPVDVIQSVNDMLKFGAM